MPRTRKPAVVAPSAPETFWLETNFDASSGPFVKLDRADLPARGTPERAEYRAARRQAARAQRRALRAAQASA